MNKEAYIKELEYLLMDIPETDRTDALAYYIDYLDEAGPEREAEVLKEFGSPERLAAIIRQDLVGNMEKGGEFTETGYQDDRFKDPNYQVAKRLDLPEKVETTGGQNQSKQSKDNNKTLKMLILAVLAILFLPALLGIGGGLLGLITGLATVLLVMVFLVGLLTVVFLLTGVTVFVAGISYLGIQVSHGLLMMGGGLLALGLGILMLAFAFTFYGTFLPWLLRGIIECFNRLFHRRKGGDES